MKLMISDFFKPEKKPVVEREAHDLSAERIKVLTMKKIEMSKRRTHGKKLTRLAVVAAVVATLTVTACAVSAWTGFLNTGGLSDREIQSLLEQSARGTMLMEHEDGSVTYYDSEGVEIRTLTAKEEAQFRRAQREEEEKELRSQKLIDIDSLELWPDHIEPIATGDTGVFGDFLLNNGTMVALGAEQDKGYSLQAGETVTISAEASRVCYVEFGMVLNGELVETELLHSDRFEKTFTVPEAGEYCFTLLYTSTDADNFTNGTIVIE